MPYKRIKEFLSYIEECHVALSKLYHRLSLEVEDEKVKLLLDYMTNKERLVCLNMHKYIKQCSFDFLNEWLDDEQDRSFPHQCKIMVQQPKLTIEDVLSLAMKFDIQLIELMQKAAHNSATIESELAFEHLTNKEEESLHEVIMASHEFEYM